MNRLLLLLVGAGGFVLAVGPLGCAQGAEFLGGASGVGGAGSDDVTDATTNTGETTSADAVTTSDTTTTADATTGSSTTGSTGVTTGSSSTSTTTGSSNVSVSTSAANSTANAVSTSATGGGGCDNQGICQDPNDPNVGCVACAFNGPCAFEYFICSFDIECLDFAACIDGCGANDQACVDNCINAYPFGAQEYSDLAFCAICLTCYNDCDGAASGC